MAMANKTTSVLFLFVGLVLGAMLMHFCSSYTIERKQPAEEVPASVIEKERNTQSQVQENPAATASIEELTDENSVIRYVKNHRKLPTYYITKAEARQLGWDAAAGNLCDVHPGKAIGRDRFSNREKQLPTNAQYYEADVNYHCGRRGADRIIFTKDGDIWLTKNHYKTFQKK